MPLLRMRLDIVWMTMKTRRLRGASLAACLPLTRMTGGSLPRRLPTRDQQSGAAALMMAQQRSLNRGRNTMAGLARAQSAMNERPDPRRRDQDGTSALLSWTAVKTDEAVTQDLRLPPESTTTSFHLKLLTTTREGSAVDRETGPGRTESTPGILSPPFDHHRQACLRRSRTSPESTQAMKVTAMILGQVL
jgi:hypothetical protein